MLNLVLTGACNLDCIYCFAKEIKSSVHGEFSIENLHKVLKLMKNDNTDTIGLLGGEPFLHSKIKLILEILKNDKNINDVIIFTNGIFDKNLCSLLSDNKFKVLVNCNSPMILQSKYDTMRENLNILNRILGSRLSIGINLPDINFDYGYIFDTAKKLNKRFIRYSFATTTETKRKINNPLEYFNKINPYIIKFYEDCLACNIVAFPSCNTIPPCIYTTRDKKTMLKMFNKCREFGLNNFPVLYFQKCRPVIDILPNLSIIRCFGITDLKKNISEFSSVTEIKKYYENQENKTSTVGSFFNNSANCKFCEYKRADLCRLCLVY